MLYDNPVFFIIVDMATGREVDHRLRKAYVEFSTLCKQHKIRVLGKSYCVFFVVQPLTLSLYCFRKQRAILVGVPCRKLILRLACLQYCFTNEEAFAGRFKELSRDCTKALQWAGISLRYRVVHILCLCSMHVYINPFIARRKLLFLQSG